MNTYAKNDNVRTPAESVARTLASVCSVCNQISVRS